MLKVMRKFWMPNFFINVIKSFFQYASVLISINNQVAFPFEFHRGVWQGCPLAPYLFIIIATTLNDATKIWWKLALLKANFFLNVNPNKALASNANGMSFTVRVEEAGVDNLIVILQNFAFAYGLEINWHKMWLLV